MLLQPHLTKHAFALELFLKRTKGLIDIVVANTYLHVVFKPFQKQIIEIYTSPPVVKVIFVYATARRKNGVLPNSGSRPLSRVFGGVFAHIVSAEAACRLG